MNSMDSTFGFPKRKQNSCFGNPNRFPIEQTLRGFDNAAPSEYGVLFEDTFQRSSLGSDYTKTGSASAVITGNELVISGGVRSASFAEYLRHTGYGFTGLDSWTQTLEYRVGTKTSSGSDTVGLSVRGVQAFSFFSVHTAMVSNTGASDGQLYLYFTSSGTLSVLTNSGAGRLTHSIGDTIRIVLHYSNHTLTSTVTNLTIGGVMSISYSPGMAAVTTGIGTVLQNMGYFSLVTYGGTQYVTKWSVKTSELKNADFAFLGDSITEGFCGTTKSDSWVSKLAALIPNRNILRLGKANATSADGINMLPEILRFKPKTVFIMLGGNDINFSVSTATWQANLKTIWQTLKNNNINIVLLLATPRSTGVGQYDMLPVNDFYIKSGYKYIDTFTNLSIGITANPMFLAADLIHPNNLGHTLTAETIFNSI